MHELSRKKKFALSIFIIFAAATLEGCWFFLKKYFDGVSLDSIIFTCHTMAISTVENRLVEGFLFELLYAYCAALILLLIIFCPFKLRVGKFNILPLKRSFILPFSLFILCGSLIHITVNLDIHTFLYNKSVETKLYDKYYVPPENVEIKFPDKKRNLIVIYMESMEATYLSQDLGGGRAYNLIPYLGRLASKNINFSQSELIGGPESLTGTGWTVAGIFGSLVGIPLSIPIYGNCYSGLGTFAPGAEALGDVLRSNGYSLAFLMGSDATFGGRRNFLELHGGFDIIDYDVAVKDGVVPEGYHVWWGFEDKYLYPYAKDKLTGIAKEKRPFCFMLLTADTHHIGGYRCSLCPNKYPVQFENVVSCADAQIADFIAWLEKQDFYKETTVVILGDHCSMDPYYFQDIEAAGYVRRPYNVFINSSVRGDAHMKNRIFTTLDYYPTLLASIGAEIPGERLGLGTNLFSGKSTLAEELGFRRLQNELSKHSDYYYDKILYGEPK